MRGSPAGQGWQGAQKVSWATGSISSSERYYMSFLWENLLSYTLRIWALFCIYIILVKHLLK